VETVPPVESAAPVESAPVVPSPSPAQTIHGFVADDSECWRDMLKPENSLTLGPGIQLHLTRGQVGDAHFLAKDPSPEARRKLAERIALFKIPDRFFAIFHEDTSGGHIAICLPTTFSFSGSDIEEAAPNGASVREDRPHLVKAKLNAAAMARVQTLSGHRIFWLDEEAKLLGVTYLVDLLKNAGTFNYASAKTYSRIADGPVIGSEQ
jgi:hypothetical protein